ncbi:MAG TPA: hypothetical protein VHD90_12890 [Phototrophicaceae bacterium]|nr:hypothetical protein [Phototrophicaceae bacterium]
MQQLDQLAEIVVRHQLAESNIRLERRRLVHEALANNRVHFYQPLLTSLGKQMVIWGTQLQRRAPTAEIDITFAAQPK